VERAAASELWLIMSKRGSRKRPSPWRERAEGASAPRYGQRPAAPCSYETRPRSARETTHARDTCIV
jgi:hypothetical protein